MERIKKEKKLNVPEPGKADRWLLAVVFLLIVFGLIMIASAGVAYSTSRFGDEYYFFKRQLFYGILPGLAGLIIAQAVNYQFWKKIAFPLFIASVIFLVLVFIPGIGSKVYGANRWVDIGILSFQPSEMLKFALIIYLASWLENRKENVKDFFEGVIPFIIIIAILSFLLIKQPDMGTLSVIILISMSMFFASGASLKHLLLIFAGGLAGFWILVKMESYRMNRLMIYLHPDLDPKGIGYQINQALLAIGSGGILGLGLGHSLQKFNYLPEPVGDSIFAIIGEELGIVGGFLLISLFVAFAWRGFRIAKHAPDEFASLVAVGITCWVTFQAFVNIGAISGLIPLTGVPLPFISYGGTSIAFLMVAVGILINISKHAKMNN
jgi:cell division protein FtsW